MNIRKVLTTKVVPALLIAALVLHLSLNVSYADSFNYSSDVKTLGYDMFDDNLWHSLFNFIESTIDLDNYYYAVVSFDSSFWLYPSLRYYGVAFSTDPIVELGNPAVLYTESSTSSLIFFMIESYDNEPWYFNYGSPIYSQNGVYEYHVTYSGTLNIPQFTYGSTWVSNEYHGMDPNLIFGNQFVPYLDVTSVDFYGSDYLSVVTNDPDFDNLDTYVTFTGVHNNDSFSHTFYRSQFIDVGADDPYVYFYLNPSSIFSDYFTLNSVTYQNTSGSYGSKTISLNLSFGTPPISYNPITEYYWSSTSVTQYNGGSAWGFDYIKVDTVDGDFWDDSKVLIQPFSFSVMAIPIMPSGITSMDYYVELVNDYLSYYDVILTEVPETTFDNLYGAGAFDDFQHSVSWAHYGNFLMDVSEWYSAHSMIAAPLDYEYYNDLPIYSSSQTCGIAFSHHFYFKQLSYMLGDTSNILSEFSSRFYEEDGFTDWLGASLTSIYDGQYDFFFDTLGYLKNFNYFVNDLVLNKYIPDSVDLLRDIKQLLGSILTSLGENAPIDLNDLESPLIDIYRFVESFYEVSKSSINELRLALTGASTGMLPGPSGTPVYLLPTSAPTPIPLPTLPSVPLLP